MRTATLVREVLREVYAELVLLVEAVDVVDDVIRYVEIINAQTDAGQRVANTLRELQAGV